MAAELLLPLARATDTNSAPYSGAQFFFYESGTLTPQAVYANATLATSLGATVTADSAGKFVPIYFDAALTYRGICKNATGSVTLHDIDPINTGLLAAMAASGGSALVGFLQAGSGAVARTVQDKLREFGVSVKDFGALADGSDDTAAIQAALDTGVRHVFVPPGIYDCANLTMTTTDQALVALGDVKFRRNANGPIITCSNDRQKIDGIAFYGGPTLAHTYTGHMIVSTGNNFRLIDCGSRWALANYRAVKCTGSHVQIIGTCDIYYTLGVGADDYDIEISAATPGTPTLYHHLFGIFTSSAGGGILLTETGTASISGCQFGKLTVLPGNSGAGSAGPFVSNCRLNGNTRIEQSNTMISNCTSSAGVTIGDGANGISGVTIADSFVIQSGQTFTVNNLITGSVFHVGQLLSNGATVSINAGSMANEIYHGPIAYTPALTALGGTPAVGDGTLTGFYSRSGRRVSAGVLFQFGSTSNLGTGETRFSLPVAGGGTSIGQGAGRILDNGTGFLPCTTFVDANGTYMTITVASITGAPAGTALNGTTPITFATGDTIKATVDYWV